MEEKPCFGDFDYSAIPFRYIAPKLTLTHEQISRCRDDNLRLLLSRKKLKLVLDLDHTLVHARKVEQLNHEDKERIKSADDVYEIFGGKIVVKLRPGIREFIKEVSSLFDVSIYTMGNRAYGVAVHRLLVSKVGFPLDCWVIAREDCVMDRQKRLDVVLSHERVVLIVDDTEDVWGDGETGNKNNLITISKYNYFPIVKRRDEEGTVVDTELGRVLNILKGVHAVFFSEDINCNEGKDVREIVVKSSNISSPLPPSDETIVVDTHTPALKDIGGDNIQPKSCKKLVIKLGGKRLRPQEEENNNITSDQQTNCAVAAKRSRKLVIKFGSLAK